VSKPAQERLGASGVETYRVELVHLIRYRPGKARQHSPPLADRLVCDVAIAERMGCE
jgi:hypothetical protein